MYGKENMLRLYSLYLETSDFIYPNTFISLLSFYFWIQPMAYVFKYKKLELLVWSILSKALVLYYRQMCVWKEP